MNPTLVSEVRLACGAEPLARVRAEPQCAGFPARFILGSKRPDVMEIRCP